MLSAFIRSTHSCPAVLLAEDVYKRQAINLFNNVINFILLLAMNWLSDKLSKTSLI